MQVIAKSEAARFNTKKLVTVRIRRRLAITTQTKVLPMTLIRKIMAYNESLIPLMADDSPEVSSEMLTSIEVSLLVDMLVTISVRALKKGYTQV